MGCDESVEEGGGRREGRGGKRREEEGRDACVGVPFEFKDEVVVIGHAKLSVRVPSVEHYRTLNTPYCINRSNLQSFKHRST